MSQAMAINVNAIVKSYGMTLALNEASLAVPTGQVHALLGENGAGKSTTVKILSGLEKPDKGDIHVFGDNVQLRSPRDAHRHGIQTAFQELTLIPDITVLQNLLMPYAPTNSLGLLRSREARQRVVAELSRLDLDDINPRAEVRDLDLPTRQKLEIAKSVIRKPRILLLDEPTSALSGRNVDWLESIMQTLRDDGVTIIFITHRMQEVRSFCQALTVYRDGQRVGTGAVTDYTDNDIVELMLGHTMTQSFPSKSKFPENDSKVLLSVRDLSIGEKLTDLDLDIHQGEVVGVAALQGMGQTELYRSLFGLESVSKGTLAIEGRKVDFASPRDAIRSGIGISYIPEDRKTEGLLLPMNGLQNITLPLLDRFSRFGWLNKSKEAWAVRSALDQVNVDSRALYTSCNAFSGGNQQKIVLAKWLLTQSQLMLMLDPTRGIDVGTKYEFFELIHNFAQGGGGVLFHSTDTTEIVNVAHRVIVLYNGRVVRELVGDEITEHAVLESEVGHVSVTSPL